MAQEARSLAHQQIRLVHDDSISGWHALLAMAAQARVTITETSIWKSLWEIRTARTPAISIGIRHGAAISISHHRLEQLATTQRPETSKGAKARRAARLLTLSM